MEPAAHEPGAAWRRACLYFLGCWILAVGSGAVSTIASQPVVGAGQVADAGWWLSTLACLALVTVGYWVIWPMGTRTFGRPFVVPDTLVFGILWGVSEGLLFASVWLTVDRVVGGWQAGDVWTAAVTIVVISAWVGLWHALYWDVRVAPEHNVPEWNLRKVLLVHTPNVVFTTIWVTVHGNLGLWVGLQTVALLGSTVTMRFPTFRRLDSSESAAHL